MLLKQRQVCTSDLIHNHHIKTLIINKSITTEQRLIIWVCPLFLPTPTITQWMLSNLELPWALPKTGMARTHSHVPQTKTTAPSSLSTADWNGSQLAGPEKGSMGGIIMFSGWEGRVEHTHREFVCRAVQSVKAQMHCGEHLAYCKVVYYRLLHHWNNREDRKEGRTSSRWYRW